MTYVLNLKPETVERIEEQARAQNVSPEQLLDNLFEQENPAPERKMSFEEATEYALKKNAELYKRLA